MALLGSLASWSPVRLAGAGALVAAVIAIGVLSLASASGPPTFSGGYGGWEPFAEPQPAPKTDFLAADGTSINLDAYDGRTVLVNFWATWCAPCVKELPALDALQGALGGPGFEVVVISIDRKGLEVAQPFLKDLGVGRLQSAADPKGALARELGATGLPTTVLIDADGMVRGRLLGDAEWNSDEAHALIRYYLTNST